MFVDPSAIWNLFLFTAYIISKLLHVSDRQTNKQTDRHMYVGIIICSATTGGNVTQFRQ